MRLKSVIEAASARQERAKKRSLHKVNEHFLPPLNEAMATKIAFHSILLIMQGLINNSSQFFTDTRRSRQIRLAGAHDFLLTTKVL